MVTIDTARYQPVAGQIIRKLSDLLDGLILVVNHAGVVVASTRTQHVGQPAQSVLGLTEGPLLRTQVPFDCDPLDGEVIVERTAVPGPAGERLTRAVVEMVVNQVTAARWLPSQAELKHKFIYDILHDRIRNREVLIREGQILGMDLSQPRSVILVNAADYIHPPGSDGRIRGETSETRVRQRARFIITSIVGFFELPDDTICAYIGDGEIAVLKAVSSQTLRHWSDDRGEQPADCWVDLPALRRAATALLKRLRLDTGATISIGIGRYHSGPDGLSRSYNDARIALTIGNRYYGSDKVHAIDDLGLAAFVGGADEQTKLDLASFLLNPLRDEHDLLETLTTYLETGRSPSDAAQRLAIHRNTLGHRLDRITRLVGLDPRVFDDAIQLRLALLMQSLPGG